MNEAPQETAPAPVPASWVKVSLVREGASYATPPIMNAAGVWQRFPDAATWPREHFLVLHLDGKNRLLGIEETSVGTATAALVHPREVFLGAILANAASVILAHNHPSGDPTPSAEDAALTARLRQAGELLGVRVLDHVVLGAGRFVSMAEEAGW